MVFEVERGYRHPMRETRWRRAAGVGIGGIAWKAKRRRGSWVGVQVRRYVEGELSLVEHTAPRAAYDATLRLL
jgi:hypothetical protein